MHLIWNMRSLKFCMCVERNETPDEGGWSGMEMGPGVGSLEIGVAWTTGHFLLQIKKNLKGQQYIRCIRNLLSYYSIVFLILGRPN